MEMHKTVGKAGLHVRRPRGRKPSQGQLDQMLSEKMSQATANHFSGPMFDLYNWQMQTAGR